MTTNGPKRVGLTVIDVLLDFLMATLDVAFTSNIRIVRFLRSHGGKYLCPLGIHTHWNIFAHPDVNGMTSSLSAMVVKRVSNCSACTKFDHLIPASD